MLSIWLAGAVCLADPPATGRVLVLDNDRILEGVIEQVGDQYRVRRAAGETWIKTRQVRALCQSLEEAYIFLRDRANLDDADERLRLARWCRTHGLNEQALHEATSARQLRPSHQETLRLIQLLQRSAPPRPAAASAAATPEPEPLPPVDCDSAAIGLFVTKVQPILMNTCVNCHGGGRSGAFKLSRAYRDTQSHPRVTRQNLAAVMAQVRRDQPGDSPLLSWAVTVHGDADKPPIKDRQAPAYRTLEEWVRLAVKAPNPRPDAAPPVREIPVEPLPAEGGGTPFAAGASPPRREARGLKPPAEEEPKMESVEPQAPLDPFDPDLFNRQRPAEPPRTSRKDRP